MGKLKYHSKGLGKNKAIKELRNHPLPTLLMAKINEPKRLEPIDGRIRVDIKRDKDTTCGQG